MTVLVWPNGEIYKNFLSGGGSVRFELEPQDISNNGDFEKAALLRPLLDAGFELLPPIATGDAEQATPLSLYGGTWHDIQCQVYGRKGTIRYKRLEAGRYEAMCTVPIKTPTSSRF